MGDTYAEAGVPRLPNMKTYLIKFLLIVLTLSCGFLTVAVSPVFFTFLLVCIVADTFLFPRLNVEYEYIYCDGQIDFDRISGKAKRKRMLRIDMDQVEIVAPATSHALDSYKNNTNFKLKNYSSLRKDVTPYVIYYASGETKTKILFEPSSKMLDCMKYKAPRKVMRD
ncbi:DUF6106 family protein [Anaerosporobacter faecicola]|uniref:DUF6106 family protein n=1 Tax=Anaerosporobacter faecicola TaxID=2718714 RepID=UPI00143B7C45|nr:DUF6106 family protein [Anaerosporobacter faecicola]